MSIEQKLRDNLEAAADALIVPQPRRVPLPTPTPSWRHGLGFALAGAAAVLALAVPALILWSGGDPSPELGVPTTDVPAVVGSPGGGTVLTTPSTTLAETPDPTESPATLAETTVGDYELVLLADRVDEEEPPTATLTLLVVPIGEDDPTDESVVGSPAGFFWHTVTGPDAVCEFSAEPTGDGAAVTVRILLSPSLGCSDPYVFELSSGVLSPGYESPEDVARRFVTAWQTGDEDAMIELADPEAMSQARGISKPVDPTFSGCEGAAGSFYCTWEESEERLVVRVRSEPPARVIEVFTEPTQ